MFRLLVAGGRDFYDYHFIEETLTNWLSEQDIESQEITLVHGDAAGVDRIAAQWAKYNSLWIESHPADWRKFGKSGGAMRNIEMAKSGIDYAIIFPGGHGTENMKRNLRIYGISYKDILDVHHI